MKVLLTLVIGPVYSVHVCPTNPDLVASGGGDDKAFLWSAPTGDVIAELSGR